MSTEPDMEYTITTDPALVVAGLMAELTDAHALLEAQEPTAEAAGETVSAYVCYTLKARIARIIQQRDDARAELAELARLVIENAELRADHARFQARVESHMDAIEPKVDAAQVNTEKTIARLEKLERLRRAVIASGQRGFFAFEKIMDELEA